MGRKLDLSRYSVLELVQRIQSRQVAPGCGAAAAVTLALSAACAGKAVAVTLKHRPSATALRRARVRLRGIARRALAGAERDAESFVGFVRARDGTSARRLLHAGESLTAAARELLGVLGSIEPRVLRRVSADVSAARALCAAALEIERTNLAENREALAASPRALPARSPGGRRSAAPAAARRRSRRSSPASDR